jgi:hypothetical protein
LCLIIGLASFGKAASGLPKGVAANSALAHSTLAAAHFAIADFDGDNRPDLATVQTGQISAANTRYWIVFRLSTGLRQSVGLTAPAGGLEVASRDVNGDSFLDLVITTQWTNRPVAVLLNDGRGNFTRSDPSGFQVAFRASDFSCNYATNEVKDGAAALLAPQNRPGSGDCEETSDISLPCSVSRPPTAHVNQRSILSRSVAFLGRAPPPLT